MKPKINPVKIEATNKIDGNFLRKKIKVIAIAKIKSKIGKLITTNSANPTPARNAPKKAIVSADFLACPTKSILIK